MNSVKHLLGTNSSCLFLAVLFCKQKFYWNRSAPVVYIISSGPLVTAVTLVLDSGCGRFTNLQSKVEKFASIFKLRPHTVDEGGDHWTFLARTLKHAR